MSRSIDVRRDMGVAAWRGKVLFVAPSMLGGSDQWNSGT